MNEQLMDIKDLAGYLQMNKMTIYKLAREGTIPAFKVASEWRFRRDLIDAWLMKQVSKSAAPRRSKAPEFTPMTEGVKRVLVVDDEPAVQSLYTGLLDGYAVSCVASGEEALETVLQNRPDLVLLDYRMTGIDGIETLKRIKEIDRSIAVIMLSAFTAKETELLAVRLGAHTSLPKPVDCLEMRQAIDEAVSTACLEEAELGVQ